MDGILAERGYPENPRDALPTGAPPSVHMQVGPTSAGPGVMAGGRHEQQQ
jgi:hypothetical protein